MRIAITGATGFVGRRAVARALSLGYEIRALVRPASSIPAAWSERVQIVRGDLTDLAGESAALLEGADALVHLAAAGGVRRSRSWSQGYDVNVVAPVTWARRASEHGVRRIVAGGTCFEYMGHGRLPDAPWTQAETPTCAEDAPLQWHDPYGATKAAGGVVMRGVARELGLNVWCLRFSALYGADDEPERLVPSAVRAAIARQPFEMTRGEQVREILHVEDAVTAIFTCVSLDPPGGVRVVNVGTGVGLTLRALVGRIFDAVGTSQDLVLAGARPYRPNEAHYLVMRVDSMREATGWSSEISLDEGIRALVRGRAHA